MGFEWNPRKARENAAKHRVAFEVAKSVFDDPRVVLAEDADHIRIIGAGCWTKGTGDHPPVASRRRPSVLASAVTPVRASTNGEGCTHPRHRGPGPPLGYDCSRG